MSRSTIWIFRDGVVDEGREFPNAFLGHAFIWDAIYNAYLKVNEWDNWLADHKRLWALAREDRLLCTDAIMLVASFDDGFLAREDFAWWVAAAIVFIEGHDPSRKSHLPAWVNLLGELSKEGEAVGGIAWWATSVTDDPWHDREDGSPYRLEGGERHWSIKDAYETRLEGANADE